MRVARAVDTHALAWFLSNDKRLSRTARDELLSPDCYLLVPAIVLAEIAYLAQRRRIDVTLANVVGGPLAAPNCELIAVDLDVVRHMPPQLDIHDALIVASALAWKQGTSEEVAIITKDRQIHRHAGLPVIW